MRICQNSDDGIAKDGQYAPPPEYGDAYEDMEEGSGSSHEQVGMRGDDDIIQNNNDNTDGITTHQATGDENLTTPTPVRRRIFGITPRLSLTGNKVDIQESDEKKENESVQKPPKGVMSFYQSRPIFSDK